MASGYSQRINVTTFDDFDYIVTRSQIPPRVRIVKAWFTVKKRTAQLDVDALYGPLVIGAVPDAATGSAIIADGSSEVVDPNYADLFPGGVIPVGTALMVFKVPRAALGNWPVGPLLPFDVQILASSGLEGTIRKGVFKVDDQVTQAQ